VLRLVTRRCGDSGLNGQTRLAIVVIDALANLPALAATNQWSGGWLVAGHDEAKARRMFCNHPAQLWRGGIQWSAFEASSIQPRVWSILVIRGGHRITSDFTIIWGQKSVRPARWSGALVCNGSFSPAFSLVIRRKACQWSPIRSGD